MGSVRVIGSRGPGTQGPTATFACVGLREVQSGPLCSRRSEPIQRINARSCVSMKRRVRPIRHPSDTAMLHRIEVDVIEMMFEVIIVGDQVLPVSALPEAALAFGDPRRAPMFAPWDSTRERLFDVRPPDRKIGISWRQRPQAMHMIRQHHDRIDGERPRRMRNAERMAQVVDMVRQQRTPPLGDGNREKVGAARHPRAAIIWHRRSIPDRTAPRRRKTPHPIVGNIRCRRRVGFMPTIAIHPPSYESIEVEASQEKPIFIGV